MQFLDHFGVKLCFVNVTAVVCVRMLSSTFHEAQNERGMAVHQ